MLKIPKNIRDEMLAQARKEAPIEACGYLAGKNGQVKKLFALKNAAASSERFFFEPKEQFQAAKDTRAAGLELLAVYHSHPATPARPSEEDLKLAFDPDIIYVIVSLLKSSSNVTAFLLMNFCMVISSSGVRGSISIFARLARYISASPKLQSLNFITKPITSTAFGIQAKHFATCLIGSTLKLACFSS